MKNYLQSCCSLSMIPLIKTKGFFWVFFKYCLKQKKEHERVVVTNHQDWVKNSPTVTSVCLESANLHGCPWLWEAYWHMLKQNILSLQTNTNLMQNVRIYSKCFSQIGNYFVPWMWTKPAPHLSLSRWQDTVNHIDHTDQIRLSHCNRFTSWFTLQSTVMWDFPRAVWKGDCQHLN